MDRLDKSVASRAGLSRKDAAQAIRRGRVTVEGQVIRRPAQRVQGELRLDGEVLRPAPLLAIFHKPAGVQSTVGDPWGRASLSEVAAPLLAQGLHPVGRLDAETTGLLPFSSDGALTQRLLHPRHQIPKTYRATVQGAPGPELKAQLSGGISTAMGVHTATVHRVEGAQILLSVTEGKHRMVRRMLANAGHPVLALHRLKLGALELGSLAEGEAREATEAERIWAEGLLA